MRAHELKELLSKRMSEKGYGHKQITANGGFQVIIDVEFCAECDQLHIVTEPSLDAKELWSDESTEKF